MSELILDVDPGKLPPRTRRIFLDVGAAIEQGWKPIELAQQLGVAPSFLSECIGELRTALGLVNGVFPTASDEAFTELLWSVAERGVEVPVVLDEHGIIDGHARVRAVETLEWIVAQAAAWPEWERIAEQAADDRGHAREVHGKETVETCERLAEFGPRLVMLAGERHWEDPPIDRRAKLPPAERRRLAVLLNAHRRHLHRGDLRLLVEVELMLAPKRSDAEIGRLVGCTGQWVGQIRAQLVEDEKLFADAQPDAEVKPLSAAWKPVVELDCPHCSRHLALERAGRDFRLELTAGPA